MDRNMDLTTGDVVRISQKIIEGKRERVINYRGVIVRVKGSGDNKTLTLRQTLEGVTVERILPVNLPSIVSITVETPTTHNTGKLRLSHKDKRIAI